MSSDSNPHDEGCCVSLVVPARNEADRLPATGKRLGEWAQVRPGAEVVLAVDAGSADGTVAIAEELAAANPRIRVAYVRTTGKGYAVHAGVEEARGRTVVMADADLAVDPDELDPLIAEAERGRLAVGSRSVLGARRIGEPLGRYLIGRAFNVAVRTSVLPGIRDSQCGFKAFPRDGGLTMLRPMVAPGWVFDVELLARARRDGMTVVEVPVVWRYRSGSTLRPFRDLPRIAAELLRVRRVVGRQPKRVPGPSEGPPSEGVPPEEK